MKGGEAICWPIPWHPKRIDENQIGICGLKSALEAWRQGVNDRIFHPAGLSELNRDQLSRKDHVFEMRLNLPISQVSSFPVHHHFRNDPSLQAEKP